MTRGRKQCGTTNGLTISNLINPAAILESLENVRTHRHAADVLNITARDWLPVGNDRECLHHGARVLERLVAGESLNILLVNRLHPESVATCDNHQLNTAVYPLKPKLINQIPDDVRAQLPFEESAQFVESHRLRGCQQRRLKGALCFRRVDRRRHTDLGNFRDVTHADSI